MNKPNGDLTGKLIYNPDKVICPFEGTGRQRLRFPNCYRITRLGDKGKVYWCRSAYIDQETDELIEVGREMLFTETEKTIEEEHFEITEIELREITKEWFKISRTY